jgi:hypothetical protein
MLATASIAGLYGLENAFAHHPPTTAMGHDWVHTNEQVTAETDATPQPEFGTGGTLFATTQRVRYQSGRVSSDVFIDAIESVTVERPRILTELFVAIGVVLAVLIHPAFIQTPASELIIGVGLLTAALILGVALYGRKWVVSFDTSSNTFAYGISSAARAKEFYLAVVSARDRRV